MKIIENIGIMEIMEIMETIEKIGGFNRRARVTFMQTEVVQDGRMAVATSTVLAM